MYIACAGKPSSQHLTLTKRMATTSCDFSVAHLSALVAGPGESLCSIRMRFRWCQLLSTIRMCLR